MRSIGVDPGKEGALCLLDGAHVELVPMPLVKATVVAGKKRGRDEYDLSEICQLLERWREQHMCFVTVEKSQPLPALLRKRKRSQEDEPEKSAAGGSIANFNRGEMRGWAWMLTAIRLPFQLVAPRTWQKVMHAGTPQAETKRRSILAAQRLFPAVDLRRTERSRKPHDGIADALLLAEFGRRTQNGGVS